MHARTIQHNLLKPLEEDPTTRKRREERRGERERKNHQYPFHSQSCRPKGQQKQKQIKKKLQKEKEH